jgi:hypothetical protein
VVSKVLRHTREYPSHFVAGVLTPVVGYFVGAWLAGILCALFLAYEIQEWAIVHDKAYLDILEYAIACYTASTVLLVMRLLSLL